MTKKMSVEERYQQMTPQEHILKLPDTYIGSIANDNIEMWIYDEEEEKINKKIINYIPGFHRIFDEIIVNARDNVVRDSTCKNIKVTFNKETGEISVWNDGKGIPIVIHKELGVYIPEMIFGKLLTSENYNTKGKIVGGKNGYGAKLTNIWSKLFIIETVDSGSGKHYYQEFSENMSQIATPKITNYTKSSYTKITYIPDYKRFGMKGLTNDMLSLCVRRVYDIAMCTSVNVFLNDVKIKCDNLEMYSLLYYDKSMRQQMAYEKVNSRWEVCAVYDNTSGFNHASFVNGISTYHGGTHVAYILGQITDRIMAHIRNKHKSLTIKPSLIRDNLTLFINCVIEDPSFSSQAKETLTTKSSDYGSHMDSKCQLSDKFIKKIIDSGIVDEIVNYAQFNEMKGLKKTDGKKVESIRGIEKLDDAINAGTRKSKDTRLILTEGDSAKSIAKSGLEVIGRENFGIFPLKGKLLNMRNATPKQIRDNKEMNDLKKIIGLKHGEIYTDVNKLRYGGIVILADQDDDGTHIRGLILNMIEFFWPSLLEINSNFVQTMSTPIIKVFDKNEVKQVFYNKILFEEWNKTNTKKYRIKYYKGLGTSGHREAIEIFEEYSKRVANFVWEEPANKETEESVSHNALLLAFDSKRANLRKKWLYDYDPNLYLAYDTQNIKISDFVHKDLIHFSSADNIRSIPSICDGLKPSQRKILFAAFKRGANSEEIKVSQFAGYVAQYTEYHHGENSLNGAIVGMAQNYIGSNNINFLKPIGSFGYRDEGGKNSASTRYIYTKMNKITTKLFRQEDTCILTFLQEDNMQIQPEHYIPIIPTLLVNGSIGIGTGFSTKIYPYNPMDLIKCIKNLIEEREIGHIHPWWRGFKGTIKQLSDSKYNMSGKYEILDNKTIHITEIPIQESITNYKKMLESKICEFGKDGKIVGNGKIEKYLDNSGINNVDFKITFVGDELRTLVKNNNVEKYLKLSTTLSLTNFYLFNVSGNIKKYDSVEDIIIDFYEYRLAMYEKRKEIMLASLKRDLDIIKYKVKFIKAIINGKLIVNNKNKEVLYAELEKMGYPQLGNERKESYRYLTDMPIMTLTHEKIEELEKEFALTETTYNEYLNTSIKQIWLKELNEFIDEYNIYLKEVEIEYANISKKKEKKKIKRQ